MSETKPYLLHTADGDVECGMCGNRDNDAYFETAGDGGLDLKCPGCGNIFDGDAKDGKHPLISI